MMIMGILQLIILAYLSQGNGYLLHRSSKPANVLNRSGFNKFGAHMIDPMSFFGGQDTNTVVQVSETSMLSWLSFLDASRFPFFAPATREFIGTFPEFVRIGLGFLAIDFIPTVFDVIFLRILWKRVIAVRPANKDIDLSSLPKVYDYQKIEEFYSKQPQLVAARATEIFVVAKDFLLGLFDDYRTGKTEENQSLRARQFTEIITTLGPAFIKVGQALSIRPDLCSPAYLEELIKLQDKVPPFSSEEALRIIAKEFKKKGVKVEEVFQTLDAFDKPIAAASLGQVYKAKLKDGTYVAVKVQRPDMYLIVTLDLFIMEMFFKVFSNSPILGNECKGMVLAIDNWAARFVDELDYFREIDNAELFRSQMMDSKTTLGDAIVVPIQYRKYCSEKLCVSQWIDGTKLSKIDVSTEKGKETVRKLTKVLLNSYLVQLL